MLQEISPAVGVHAVRKIIITYIKYFQKISASNIKRQMIIQYINEVQLVPDLLTLK